MNRALGDQVNGAAVGQVNGVGVTDGAFVYQMNRAIVAQSA